MRVEGPRSELLDAIVQEHAADPRFRGALRQLEASVLNIEQRFSERPPLVRVLRRKVGLLRRLSGAHPEAAQKIRRGHANAIEQQLARILSGIGLARQGPNTSVPPVRNESFSIR